MAKQTSGGRRGGKSLKAIDDAITRIYSEDCRGVSINVLDIADVFEAGRAAALAGGDIRAAVLAKVNELKR